MTDTSGSFRLEVGASGLATLTFSRRDRRANILSTAILDELSTVVEGLRVRSDIGVLVLLSGRPGSFVPGADVEEIARVDDPAVAEAVARRGQAVFSAWSELPFPTVAAVDGTCLGGGTEWSLASTHIAVADDPKVRIGLPEVKLGIVPGWGGCSRLPRRIGIAAALDLILAGKDVSARSAHRLGLADSLLPAGGFRRHVREVALALAAGTSRRDTRPDLRELLLEHNPVGRALLFDRARRTTLEVTRGNYPAPLRALEVVRLGVERGLAAGLEAEARAIGELATSPICKNLVRLFLLQETAKKRELDAEAVTVREVAVIGAGVMGGGIAALVADKADLPVRLKDIATAGLATAMEHAANRFGRQVERRRLAPTERARKMALIRPTLGESGFGRCDLAIEAVVEDLTVKRQVLAEAAARLAPGAVLATNTSALDLDAIASDVAHPERVVGMHFFNPVHRMPLVEVVVGPHTGAGTAATVVAFARRLGKVPIVVRNGPGFLVNRLLGFYMVEALWLLHEGCAIETVDRTMEQWGMPMGPIALIDEVGIDVAFEVAHVLQAAFGDRLPLPPWLGRALEGDERRLGRKGGRGFYRYDRGRRTEPDPKALAQLGLGRRSAPSRGVTPLVDRMVLPMIDEAARCLDEGIVASPGDVDLAMIMGTGFPPFRGGLLRWADQQGVGQIVVELERLSVSVGDRFAPSPALRAVAGRGGFHAELR